MRALLPLIYNRINNNIICFVIYLNEGANPEVFEENLEITDVIYLSEGNIPSLTSETTKSHKPISKIKKEVLYEDKNQETILHYGDNNSSNLFITKYFINSAEENIEEIKFFPMLNIDNLRAFLEFFWVSVMNKLKHNQYLIILIKVHVMRVVELSDGEKEVTEFYISLGKVERITRNDLIKYLEILEIKLADLELDDWYKLLFIKKLIAEYWVKDNPTESSVELLSSLRNIKRFKNPNIELRNIEKIHYKNKIPLNRDYLSWGKLEYQVDNELHISSSLGTDKKHRIFIQRFNTYNKITISSDGVELYQFEDHSSSIILNKNNLDSESLFTRLINSQEFIIDENKGEIVLKSIKFKMDVLEINSKDPEINENFITLDIETMVKDGEHVPYCVCFYDGADKYSYYLTDYNNPYEMLTAVVRSLLRKKYSGYNVYVHNLSRFDGIFLFSVFANDPLIKVDPVLRDGNFINIKLNYGPEFKYNLSFHDSYLLLPLSLKKLGKQFKVSTLKSEFPYNFLNNKYNKNLDLNYIGIEPNMKIKSLTQFSLNRHINFVFDENKKTLLRVDRNVNDKWSLREETIKYCITDCISLYEVLIKFNKFIFNKFKVNISKSPTLPSLTFKIFRTNYLSKLEKAGYYIPLINGEMFNELMQSYTGGSTDVFKPSNIQPDGSLEPVKGYDVNSLYPTSMSKGMLMPVISKKNKYITYFEGDISKYKKNAFGFFNVDVQTKIELDQPILQMKYSTGYGFRTISPLGSWSSMYFSEEINNAISEKNGYEVKIKSGYLFEKKDIFGDFIGELYKIKEAHTKNDPWYVISKMLMNSLYGRFGMDPENQNHLIIDASEMDDYRNKGDILAFESIINFSSDSPQKLLITFVDKEQIENNKLRSKKRSVVNSSVAIASAITAYARIFMSFFKNNPNYTILYTDTDSLYIIGDLDPKYIGTKLGQFKLENIFNEVVYLAPKVYGGITVEGEEITKVKGYKNHISYEELKLLLKKDTKIKLEQEKWYKNMFSGSIRVEDQLYMLTVTDNKRQLIYNKNGILVDTKPFTLENGSIVANVENDENKA